MSKDKTESELISGQWRGYYTYDYSSSKHWMDLNLDLSKGRITGDGIDDIARFVVTGRYDLDKKECYLTKQYIGRHSVFYKGFIDLRRIWGLWSIEDWQGGGFVIWPKGYGEALKEEAREEKTLDLSKPLVTKGRGLS